MQDLVFMVGQHYLQQPNNLFCKMQCSVLAALTAQRDSQRTSAAHSSIHQPLSDATQNQDNMLQQVSDCYTEYSRAVPGSGGCDLKLPEAVMYAFSTVFTLLERFVA